MKVPDDGPKVVGLVVGPHGRALNVYAHVLPEAHKQMANVMEQIVSKRRRSN